ncbi:MAG TPA: DNA polymerase [Pseudonocardiaceae bacterium]|nr:DNA polymerase [Pseudonocardiaceae bacterium]
MLAKLSKPPACHGCQLETLGNGFASYAGPRDARLLFVGESLGFQEAMAGEPFVGAAGAMFERLLARAQLSRQVAKVHNCVNCSPPENWLDGAPWEHSALTHCRTYLQESLDNAHLEVVVTLGSVALKQVLDLWGVAGVRIQDFHGTVHRDPANRYFVIPTYHPSHLQRGATNLFDVVRHDIGLAQDVLHARGYSRRPVSLLLDPPVEQFRSAVQAACARVRRGELVYLPIDIETPETAGRDENELTAEDPTANIQRVNGSFGFDDGWTVPYEGPYVDLVDQLLTSGAWLVMWNKWFDESRLRVRGHQFRQADGSDVTILDAMWAAHYLQSDWPLGLGFWAPFYSDYGVWKHLAKVKGQDALYAAVDGLQTNRVGPYGVFPALVKDGLWDAFWRHSHLREQYVLRPSYEQGVPVSVDRLDAFHTKLQGIAADRLTAIQHSELVGVLHPKNGYKKKPKSETPPKTVLGRAREKGDAAKADYIAQGVRLVERTVTCAVQSCRACGKSPVGPAHNCLVRRKRKRRAAAAADLTPSLLDGDPGLADPQQPAEDDAAAEPHAAVAPLLVTSPSVEQRWFWQLPFNPDSSRQILKFIKDSGESPGKEKHTKKETGDKATLKKLAKKTGNPVYQQILDYKAVKKVDSVYVVGTKRRLWKDNRVHPLITQRPSMFRDSSVNPNLQNVIADKSGRSSLAAGFRDCIVADPGYRIVEIDYGGTEGVDTGWMIGDPVYIRLATLGVHAYLTAHLLHEKKILQTVPDLSWSDSDLVFLFKEIKKYYPADYDRAKRCVHGNNYGLTVYGMHETFPEDFPTLKDAQYTQDLYYALCPKLPEFHERVRAIAYDQGYLGGPFVDDYTLLTRSGKHHPFGYRHWFWGVQSVRPLTEVAYRKLQWIAKNRLKRENHPRVRIINRRPFEVVPGEDSKRVIALFPQSITAGKLKEAQLNLLHPESRTFIGHAAEGKTPLLHPIHDSLLFHFPDRVWEWAASIAVLVMRAPCLQMPCPEEWGIGSHIRTNVEVKVSPVGGSWAECEPVPIDDRLPETAIDATYLPIDEEDLDEVDDLKARLLQ